MQNVSTLFKQASKSNSRELILRIDITTEDGTVHSLGPEDISQGSVSWQSRCFSSGFELGNAMADDFAFSLKNFDGEWDEVNLSGATVKPYSGFVLEDGSKEYVPLGNFVVDKQSRPNVIVQIKCSDRMILLDEPFSKVPLIFPASLSSIAQAVASHCNVPLSTSFVTNDYTINERPEDDVTCRDIIGDIAFYQAGFAYMDRSGVLSCKALVRNFDEEIANGTAYEMKVGSRISFKEDSELITITGLEVEGKLYGTNDYAIKVDGLSLKANESSYQAVFDQISGFSYTAYTATYFGDPSLDVGDYVVHETVKGNTIRSLVSLHVFKYGGNSTLEAKAKTKQEQGYRSANARRIQSAVIQATEDIRHDFSVSEQNRAQLNDALSSIVGLYKTTEKLEDGSEITYWHDKPLLSESQVVWKLSGGALGWSNDGGKSYSGVNPQQDNIITKVMDAYQVNAEKIIVGEGEAKKSLAKALEELNLQDASVDDILSTIQTQMVNRDEFVSAQESYNSAKEAYDKSLLDSQATDEEIQNRLKDLDEARTSYETRVNDLNETLKVYEETLENVSRSFRTDELGRPLISKPGSDTNLLLDNDGMYIQVGGSTNAYFTKDDMLVTKATIQTLSLGDHQIKVDADGKGFNIVNT